MKTGGRRFGIMKHKIMRFEEDGVAGAITVVLVIALVAILLSYFMSVVVPATMSQYEFTLDQELDASILQFSSDMVSMESTGTIGSVDFQNFILQTNSVPIVSTPSTAALSFTSCARGQPFSYTVSASSSVTGLPESTFYGGGGMEIANGNRFYSAGVLYYQGGSVYETPYTANGTQSALALSTLLEYSPGTNTYSFNVFNIYGTAEVVSSGSVNLEIEYSGTSTLSVTSLSAPLPVYVNFTSDSAARVFYQGVLQLFPGAVYDNGADTGVEFVIPSGVNVNFSVSSFAISEYGLVK